MVFINLPTEGDAVTAGESFGDVESVKAVSDIISPVSGTICAVNEALADAPETLNSDPYGAWIIKVEGIGGTEELLDAAAYEAHCAEEADGLLCSDHRGGTGGNACCHRGQKP